jgi:hypothetical protein
MLAGVPGFEPGLSVLETDVLAVDTIPLQTLPIVNCRFQLKVSFSLDRGTIGNWKSPIGNVLLGLFVTRVFAATPAELAELEPVGRCLLVFRRHVVAAFALTALQHNVIAWHISLPISDCQFPLKFFG